MKERHNLLGLGVDGRTVLQKTLKMLPGARTGLIRLRIPEVVGSYKHATETSDLVLSWKVG